VSLLDAMHARLAAAGLDLVAGFAVDAWNASAPEHVLPDLGRERALAVVIGNSGALWPRLCAALAADRALAAEPDPLDRHTERTIEEAVASLGVRAAIRFAHRPPYPPIQRMADHAGLAHLQPSHLCVHPVLGPWIAMRAVVVLDAEGPPAPAPTPPPCDCARGCLPAFERAAALGFDPDHEPTWRAWVAIRDACPIGHDRRYPDDQIRYHYGKDRDALARAVAEAGAPGAGSDPSP
jgi:methylmalonic aciduria homocystinuria type C protein